LSMNRARSWNAECCTFLPASKTHKVTARLLTYARRYSLLAATGLAPEDDDGNSASRRTEIKSTVNENQIADLLAAMDEVTTIKELQEAYKEAYKATNGEQAWQTDVIAKKDAKKPLEATLKHEISLETLMLAKQAIEELLEFHKMTAVKDMGVFNMTSDMRKRAYKAASQIDMATLILLKQTVEITDE
jgi:hypothetical protein